MGAGGAVGRRCRAHRVLLSARAVLAFRAARTGSVRATALLHFCGPAPQQMADAVDECGGTGAMAPPSLVDATPDNTDDAAAATPAVAAAQVAAAAARELYLSIVHSALGRPATVHMVDGYVFLLVSAARVATLVATAVFCFNGSTACAACGSGGLCMGLTVRRLVSFSPFLLLFPLY